MRKKRSKFLTVVFSFLPGAGHMFMGFMKLGVSMMGLFFLVIFLSTWLSLGALIYLLPVLWFYSFFDSINKRYSTDEEFEAFEDHYLLSMDKIIGLNGTMKKNARILLGILLILIGGYSLWTGILNNIINRLIPGPAYNALIQVMDSIPQFVLGIVIVAAGIWLIMGKKKEMDNNA